MRSEYRKRALISDHWQYKDDKFTIGVEMETFALKRMNCPSHCLIFKSRERSYRELPWTMADFGVLHKNQYSGSLTGLTLVRGFQQYDIHTFCTHVQIEDEITGVLDFLRHIYDIFGFTFKLEISTHSEKFLGEMTWTDAEKHLIPWELNPGDGAFYGRKVDVTNIADTLQRYYQFATIQLDYYVEYFVGKWPFWLSPRKLLVITVGVEYNDFADEVRKALFDAGIEVGAVFALGSGWVVLYTTQVRKSEIDNLHRKNGLIRISDLYGILSNLS
ncbi:hypothetical protein V1508DRAFT_407300 [Lipomyces doorenjongii]|uniref:uncharacterized protein n=1 Tax=Lipomyces doorenjongii TaxID=383834 RepID=UPI0034CEFA13